MNVLVAGASGAIGHQLVPRLSPPAITSPPRHANQRSSTSSVSKEQLRCSATCSI